MKKFVHISTIEEVHKMLGINKPTHPMVSVIPITNVVSIMGMLPISSISIKYP